MSLPKVVCPVCYRQLKPDRQPSVLEDLGRGDSPAPSKSGAHAKGGEFELQMCKLIAKTFDRDYNKFTPRSPNSGARATPEWKGDIAKIGDAVTLFPFTVECKNSQDWSFESFFAHPDHSVLYGWYKKVQLEASIGDYNPAVFFKRFGTPAFAMIEWHVYYDLTCVTPRFDPTFLVQCDVGSDCLVILKVEEFLSQWKMHILTPKD
jgi:hypothetical protein